MGGLNAEAQRLLKAAEELDGPVSATTEIPKEKKGKEPNLA